MAAVRREGRAADELRPVKVELGFNPHAEGSSLVTWGKTVVLATVTIESKLPPHMRGGGNKSGWLTAEYALLPRSTTERVPRERLYASGRTQEIQRLMGRALRSTVDLELFRGKTITVDADVLVADGGTRCAAMLEAIEAHFPEGSTWTVPTGGMFVWVELPRGVNTAALLPEVVAQEQVAYVSGAPFHPNGGGENTMRLNFTHTPPDVVRDGIARLGRALVRAVETAAARP